MACILLLFGALSLSSCAPETYTVYFDTQTDITVSHVTVKPGESCALPGIPEKTYREFLGWYATPECDGDKIVSPYYPEKTLTLYAKWSDMIDEDKFSFVVAPNYRGYLIRLAPGKSLPGSAS